MGNFGGGGVAQDAYDSAFGQMTGAAGQPTPQDLERMANAETPPALSNVEIASSILASLAGESVSVPYGYRIFLKISLNNL